MFYLVGKPKSRYPNTPRGYKDFVRDASAALDGLDKPQAGGGLDIANLVTNRLAAATPFIAEMMALLRLGYWERMGYLPSLALDEEEPLPNFRQALDDLRNRIATSPREFMSSDPSNPPLHALINKVANRRIRFDAQLKAELVVMDVDEDLLVECLAKLLWDIHLRQKKGKKNG